MKKIVHSEESNLKRINSEKKDYLKSVKVRKSTCAKPSLARDEILEKCFDAGTNAKAFSGEVNPKTDEKTSNVEPKHYQKPKYLEEISKYENTSNEPIISTFVVPEKLIIKNFNRINVKIQEATNKLVCAFNTTTCFILSAFNLISTIVSTIFWLKKKISGLNKFLKLAIFLAAVYHWSLKLFKFISYTAGVFIVFYLIIVIQNFCARLKAKFTLFKEKFVNLRFKK